MAHHGVRRELRHRGVDEEQVAGVRVVRRRALDVGAGPYRAELAGAAHAA
ncbi:hypothetical protein ACQPWY_05080 [Pseudonocardia xinjiangensis]